MLNEEAAILVDNSQFTRKSEPVKAVSYYYLNGSAFDHQNRCDRRERRHFFCTNPEFQSRILVNEWMEPSDWPTQRNTGPISFHLGCDFGRDEDGTLYYAPKKYIEKILENY